MEKKLYFYFSFLLIGKKKNGNTFKNNFYDDMAWHGLTHLRAFDATGDTRYEASARDLYNWVLQGWNEVGAGIILSLLNSYTKNI